MAYSDSPDMIEDEDSLQAPEIVPGLNKCKSSDHYDTWVVPIEVTVIEDEAGHRTGGFSVDVEARAGDVAGDGIGHGHHANPSGFSACGRRSISLRPGC